MNSIRFVVTVLSMLVVAVATRAADVVVPNANLKAENIPPIPAALVAKVAPYTEFKPTTAVSWHPKERELIVARRAGNVTQLHRVAKPGDEPRQLTDFAEPVRFGLYWPKAPDTLVYSRDTGGDEQQQLYRLDANGATPALLTDATRKNTSGGLTHARDFLLLESTDVDKAGKRENPTLDLSLLDPLDPAKSRKLATLSGTGWGDYTFSFDDKRVAMVEYISVNESYVWLMDVSSGERRRVLPPPGAKPAQPISSGDLNFARDGKGLFLATDRDGEFRKLAYLELATGKLDYFGEGGNWDVEAVALSPDGRTLAVITNEAGIGVLRLYDAQTRRALPRPPLSPFRSTAREVQAMSTRSTCRKTASRAGRRARSQVSTRRSFAMPSQSNGKASTVARLAASSFDRPQSSLEKGPSSCRFTVARRGRRVPDFSDAKTISSMSSASR